MALRVSSITETDTSSKSDSKSKEHSQSQSRSDSQSTTKKLLDSDLMNQILGGLVRNMTDEEINAVCGKPAAAAAQRGAGGKPAELRNHEAEQGAGT